jgi:O-antigen/teichoic acid export membrane protein
VEPSPGSDVSAAAVRPPTPAAPRRRLASGAFASLIAQVVVTLAATATSVAIARLLGPTGNGAVALVVNLLGMGTLVFSFGLRTGAIYEVSAGRWAVRDALRMMTRSAFALGILGSLAMLGIFLVSRDSVFSGLNETTTLAAAAALPFALLIFLVAGIPLARERYEQYASFQAIPTVALLVLAVALAIPFGIVGATVGVALSNIGAGLWTYFSVRRAASRETGGGPGRFRPALRFGLQNWGANVLQFLNYRFDLFILNSFAATAVVGVYSVAVSLTAIGWLLPNALQTVLFPRAASLDAAVAREELSPIEADDTAAKAVRQSVALLLPTAVVLLGLLGVGIPLLYGSRFHDAIWLGLILLPGVSAIGVGKVMTAVTSGRGHPRYSLYIGMISAPLTLALYFATIPRYGSWGAAVATTVSYSATTLASFIFFRRVTGLGAAAFVPTRTELRDMREAVAAVADRARSALRRGGDRNTP